MRAAHLVADSRGFSFIFFKAGQKRLDQESWSGAVKKTKIIFKFFFLLRALMLLNAPDTFTL